MRSPAAPAEMEPGPVRFAATTTAEGLLAAAEEGVGAHVFHLEEGRVELSSAELAERAQRGARRLIALGVRPGDAVGVLGPNRPEWVVWAFAAWSAGAVLVPVQIPLRIRDPDAFAERLRLLVDAAGCRVVMSDPRLVPLLPEGVAIPWREGGEESGEEPAGAAPGSTAVIQFTSGSTALPKGVVVKHEAVLAQLAMLYDHYYEEGESQSTVSWVPFFHDLGLITCVIFPLFARSRVELLPTELFARDPAEWFRLIERTRGLGTLAPSSAFGSALRAAERRAERLDLSSLRVAHFAAEPVAPDVAQRMSTVATRDFGLNPEALGSTYGLAEAVLGVAYSPMGGGMRLDRVSIAELAEAGVAAPVREGPSRSIVSCGPPATELKILAPGGEELPERHVGEITVGGRSLASGYAGPGAADPFVDGWLRSGDMGYLAGGELYVTGRAKDMVIVLGQNYYPDDFEWAASRVPGVRPGRCAAFARPASEGIALLVEPLDPGADRVRLGRAVKRAVGDAVGVPPSEVVVVARGTVEKTTSGKLRRAAMREAYADGKLPLAGGAG